MWVLKLVPLAISRDEWALAVSGAMMGALLPDLDASQSKIRHLSWPLGRTHIKPFQPLATIVHKILGHRGFLHSFGGWLWVAAICLPLFWWLRWSAWFGLMLGFGSHLATDALTKSGIPFWQWRPTRQSKARRVHLVPRPLWISTGSAEEGIYFALFSVGAVALLVGVLFSPP